MSFHCHVEKIKQRAKKVYDYKNADENGPINYIKSFNFEEAVFSKSIADQAEAMTTVLADAFAKFIPVKNVMIRANDQPWVNSYTRLLLRKKNRNNQLFKKINSKYLDAKANPETPPEIVTRLLLKREQASKKSQIAMKQSTNANTRAKKNFFNSVSSTMHNCNISSKKKFSILNKLMRKNKVSIIPPIIEDGKVITEPEKKSDIFNKFFASKCSVPRAEEPAPDLPQKEDIFEKLSNFNTSPIEVAKLCR